jgi:hypothetical protein
MQLSRELRKALVGHVAMTEKLMGEWSRTCPDEYLEHKRAAIAQALWGNQEEPKRGKMQLLRTGISMHKSDI